MKKSMIALALILSTSAAFADAIRPISTQNLNCTGKSKEGETVNLAITSSRAGAHVIVDGFSDYNLNQLTVGSEGSVYMQIVVNHGFNMIVSGKALNNVLYGEIGTTAVNLTGRIDFMRGQQFDLTCKGDMTSEEFGQSLDGLE